MDNGVRSVAILCDRRLEDARFSVGRIYFQNSLRQRRRAGQRAVPFVPPAVARLVAIKTLAKVTKHITNICYFVDCNAFPRIFILFDILQIFGESLCREMAMRLKFSLI